MLRDARACTYSNRSSDEECCLVGFFSLEGAGLRVCFGVVTQFSGSFNGVGGLRVLEEVRRRIMGSGVCSGVGTADHRDRPS